MSSMNAASDMYCLIDFLHLPSLVDLQILASALRPLVHADFEYQQDAFVESMASCWGCHEVIITHPYARTQLEGNACDELSESNAATYITIVLKDSSPPNGDIIHLQGTLSSSIAKVLAKTFNMQVLHSKSWQVNQAIGTRLNRRYGCDGSLLDSPDPIVYMCGWKSIALATSIDSLRPTYSGPLDFLFIVHPRSSAEKRMPFPLMRGLDEKRIAKLVPSCTILSSIEVLVGERHLRGELVTIPHSPEEMFDHLHDARDSVMQIFDYAAYRGTKMVGLGALIPSITRQGKLLSKARPGISFTTGHGLTALTIAQMVEDIESEVGDQGVVAVVGAAGSTGRAALRCMFKRRPYRKILAVDVAQQLAKIPQIPGWNPQLHSYTAFKHLIKEASIVVCVTNAIGGILVAEDFGPNAVVLDDAQPENVSQSVLINRPDIRVVKCLARVPLLSCPFDMGFMPATRDEEVTFTCLAETILLAADDYPSSCVVGDPSDEQLNYLENLAARYGVSPAKFFSFPSIGPVDLRSMFK